MRWVVAALFGICFCGTAAAEGWQEYVYGADEFAVSFPQAPTVQSGSFQLPGGMNVPARIYSVTEADGDYRVTVADFTNRPESQNTIIDAAEKMLKQHGEVKVELPARVQAVFGRQLSLNERDGSHVSAALFVFQHRLYQITGRSAPAAALAGSSDAIRFQQSLRFTGNTVGFFGLNFLFGALRQL